MDRKYKDIEQAIARGEIDTAQKALARLRQAEGETAMTLYLQGSIAAKQASWHEAIALFSRSEAMNPDGPAQEARQMLDGIMNFYHKDLYNP